MFLFNVTFGSSFSLNIQYTAVIILTFKLVCPIWQSQFLGVQLSQILVISINEALIVFSFIQNGLVGQSFDNRIICPVITGSSCFLVWRKIEHTITEFVLKLDVHSMHGQL